MSVFIPLAVRKRNGRPRIVPPAQMAASDDADRVDPHVLRAIARAWSWRRKLESGEAATILDIAQAEDVTDRFVSRMIKLAHLSPPTLERLVLQKRSPTLSIKDLIATAELPWEEQVKVAYG
jgi:hypothetical protein